MAKSTKPRKKYNPNKTTVNTPLTIRYSKQEGDSLKYRIYFHLHRLTTDDCDNGDWLALQFRLKIGVGLAKNFIEDNIAPTINEGLIILEEIKENRIANNTWRITNEQENKLRYLLSIIDDMQDNTTRKEQLPIFIQAQKEIDYNLRLTLP